MTDIQKDIEEALVNNKGITTRPGVSGVGKVNDGLCQHGNYHCMICEVKLLKLVISEQQELIEQKDAEIEKLRVIQRALVLTQAVKEK